MSTGILIAIDIGAGSGAKIGILSPSFDLLASDLLRIDEFAGNFETLCTRLVERIERTLAKCGHSMRDASGLGIASPGVFKSDGAFHSVALIPFLNGHNLPARLKQMTGLPARIDNDANAGGLAEWSVVRTELLYWAFGGNWGGTWIDADGVVQYPLINWDGDDRSLHYTDEPGYGLPLAKSMLRNLFYRYGVEWSDFERLCGGNSEMLGPSNDPKTIRAGAILSGPGRLQLFHAIAGKDNAYSKSLMADLVTAGERLSELSHARVEAAVRTDELFGCVLAEAARVMFDQPRTRALRSNIPIFLAGKPAHALPFFGPSAQRRMLELGITSILQPSVILQRGLNPNLLGAAVLASKPGGNA